MLIFLQLWGVRTVVVSNKQKTDLSIVQPVQELTGQRKSMEHRVWESSNQIEKEESHLLQSIYIRILKSFTEDCKSEVARMYSTVVEMEQGRVQDPAERVHWNGDNHQLSFRWNKLKFNCLIVPSLLELNFNTSLCDWLSDFKLHLSSDHLHFSHHLLLQMTSE